MILCYVNEIFLTKNVCETSDDRFLINNDNQL